MAVSLWCPLSGEDTWRADRPLLDFTLANPVAWNAAIPSPNDAVASSPVALGNDGSASSIGAGAPADDGSDGADSWRFEFAPQLWAASVTGSGRVSGLRFAGTASFRDIWEKLDLGLMGRFEARKGKWSFFVDGMFLELSDDVSTTLPGVSGELRSQQWLFQWGAYYEFASVSLEDTIEDSSLAFEAMVGNRLYRVENRLDISPGPSFDGSQTWIDPIIGLRIPWRLPRNFSLVTSGDVGGFGLGSHFSWQIQSMVRYDLETRVPVFLTAGYRLLGYNYSEGNGNRKFELDLLLYGPLVAIGVAF